MAKRRNKDFRSISGKTLAERLKKGLSEQTHAKRNLLRFARITYKNYGPFFFKRWFRIMKPYSYKLWSLWKERSSKRKDKQSKTYFMNNSKRNRRKRKLQAHIKAMRKKFVFSKKRKTLLKKPMFFGWKVQQKYLFAQNKLVRKWLYLYFKALAAKKPPFTRKKSPILLFERETYWKQDIFYKSFWFSKFIAKFIKKGKKHFAENKVSQVVHLLKNEKKKHPFLSFWEILHVVKPIVNTIPKRIGKLYHNIPIPVKTTRGYKLALKWFVNSVLSKKDEKKTLTQKIYEEAINVLSRNRRSPTIKSRDALYKVVYENRAYSHFRWA